jgi:hypothetical protein
MRHRRTLIAQALLDGEAETITRKCIDLALEGDPTALKLCVERLVPPRKEGPVEFTMPQLGSVSDVAAVMTALMQAVSEGRVLLSQAVEFGKLLEMYARMATTADMPWPENLTDEQLQAQILRLKREIAVDTEWRDEGKPSDE